MSQRNLFELIEEEVVVNKDVLAKVKSQIKNN